MVSHETMSVEIQLPSLRYIDKLVPQASEDIANEIIDEIHVPFRYYDRIRIGLFSASRPRPSRIGWPLSPRKI